MGKKRIKTKPKKRHKKNRLILAQIRFCHLYFAGETRGNATQSYIRAFYPDNPPANTSYAETAAERLMRKEEIKAYFDTLARDATEAEMVTTQSVVRGFRWGAEADLSEIIDKTGSFLPVSDWPEHIRKAVSRFEAEEMYKMADDGKGGKEKKHVGTRWKVWFENKTECRKILAQIKRMIGSDVAAFTTPPPGTGVTTNAQLP